MIDSGRKVVVLSHLYPSTLFPALGPFVRDEVVELAKRNRISVVAPIIIPSIRPEFLRRAAAEPRVSVEDGVRVVRPRLPAVPVGGSFIEPYVWTTGLRPVLTRAAAELQAEVLHAHFALPDGFAALSVALRRRLPLVLTIRGSDVIVSGRHAISRRFLASTLRGADAVIAVSHDLAARAERLGVSNDRLHVVAGVPYPPLIPQKAARELLGVAEDVVLAVWVGGLVRVKQPLLAVDAFQSALRQGEFDGRPSVLAILGDGPLRGQLTAHVARTGLGEAVQILGHVDRQTVWLWECAADVLLNSSSSEGTPVAILEAVGAGTPIAAFSLPGITAVTESVEGGTIAAAPTADALGEAVSEELRIGRDRLALARRARQRYDIARAARLIESIYAAVA